LALVPKDEVLRGVYPGDAVADLADRLFDCVLRRSNDGNLQVFHSFGEALQRASEFDDAPLRNASTGGTIALRDLRDRVRLVCVDVDCGSKPFFREIARAFPAARFFSMAHGIDLHLLKSGRGASRRYVPPRIRKNCVVYLRSPREASYYREKFGIPERNLRIAGVVRHAASWLEKIRDLQIDADRPAGPYIFLASRRAGKPARFGLAQKREALKDLVKLARELRCKLVIRRHPKESEETVYEQVLGTDRYGMDWVYSSLHPFVLGNNAMFSVTFRSAVAVDMAAIGTPTIELFDFEKLELDEEPTDDRRLFLKQDGKLTSFYQRHGLVLGARDYAELKLRAEEILNDREGIIHRLSEAHRDLYTVLPDPIGYVTDDMESTVPIAAGPSHPAHQGEG
jgi:hypothetical protein